MKIKNDNRKVLSVGALPADVYDINTWSNEQIRLAGAWSKHEVDSWYDKLTMPYDWVPDWIGTWLINQEIVSQQEAPAWVSGPIGKFFGWFRLQNWHEQIIRHASLYLAGMFLTFMICHGELARSKPAPRYLTSYFLMISDRKSTRLNSSHT